MTTPPEADAPPSAMVDRAEEDAIWMARAQALADRGVGRTGANPSVGCVVADAEGRLLARGATAESGAPHAEARALAEAAALPDGPSRLRGSTVYVTLEPCAHHGRTPPCADAIIAAEVGRVVVAIEDPDARVSGRGLGRLRAAGVEVTLGVGADAATRQLAPYLLHRRTGRAHVTLKLATSLDGRIAIANGESQWISCAEARRRAHILRARANAVLVGVGTVLADDPQLTVREPGLEALSPTRVVVDSALRTPIDGKLMRGARETPVWIFCAEDAPGDARAALEAAGARVFATPRRGAGLDLVDVVDRLGREGVVALMVEGGGRIAASLVAANRVDRLALATAGVALGADGLPALGPLGLERLADAARFTLEHCERVGADVWSEWSRTEPSA